MYWQHIFLRHNNIGVMLLYLGIAFGESSILPAAEQWDVVIIGSGIAGYSAAVYAGNARVRALLVSGHEPGGQLGRALWVENIPGVMHAAGHEVMDIFHDQAVQAGVTYLSGLVSKIEPCNNGWLVEITPDIGDICSVWAPAVLMVTGARPRLLDIPDVDRAWGHGLSTCALCDSFMARDKDVVVVGSGASAAHEVLQLYPYARSVTVVMRSSGWKATVSQAMLEKLATLPIKVIENANITDIIYDSVTGDIRQVAMVIDGQEHRVSAQAIFLALGHIPASELAQGFVSCAADGAIKVDRYGYTGMPGLYAAGDVTDTPYRQAIVAAASGAIAILQAIDYAHTVSNSSVVTHAG
jgi:thioredoxin reductase (NADPH)